MKTRKRFIDHEIDIAKALQFYPFSMDILVRNPSEIRRRVKMNDPFYEEVMNKGKVLYES